MLWHKDLYFSSKLLSLDTVNLKEINTYIFLVHFLINYYIYRASQICSWVVFATVI